MNHPTTEDLDRACAGLLDGAQTAAVEAHLQHCAHCRSQSGLPLTLLGEGKELSYALAARRRAALAGENSRGQGHSFRLAALAATVALTLGVFLGLQWRGDAPERLTQARAEDVPETYADPDFYLWLSREAPNDADVRS